MEINLLLLLVLLAFSETENRPRRYGRAASYVLSARGHRARHQKQRPLINHRFLNKLAFHRCTLGIEPSIHRPALSRNCKTQALLREQRTPLLYKK